MYCVPHCPAPEFRDGAIKDTITVRLHPDLLAEVRQSAARDNRSLTNFIETALRERINGAVRSRRLSGSFKDTKNQ